MCKFANLSAARDQDDPDSHEDEFGSAINHLYLILYESTMVDKGPGFKKEGPPVPVYDPDATKGESYGRIRIWLQNLRNRYFHDIDSWPPEQQERIRQQVKQFFITAISKPGPEKSTDYLRALLFILADVVWYLDTVRERLKNK